MGACRLLEAPGFKGHITSDNSAATLRPSWRLNSSGQAAGGAWHGTACSLHSAEGASNCCHT